MINLYRFCVAILFACLSSAIAQENCKIELVPDKSYKPENWRQDRNSPFTYPECGVLPNPNPWAECVKDFGVKDYGDTYSRTHAIYYENGQFSKNQTELERHSWPLVEKEICVKPDVSDWENCRSGKDHGFSWIIIGDANGEGESRFKREFWSCDDPDFWETYDHPPEKVPTDPDKPGEGGDKPTDPTDPDKPGDGGDGDRPGEGGDNPGGENGSDNGGCIGNNCGSSGEGLSKGDITDAINDADILGCKGDGCSAVDLKGQGTDSDFAAIPNSFWESKYESHDLMKLYEEKIESKSDSIVGQLSMINTDIGEGTCPVIELPDGFEDFQVDCNFLLLIRAAFIFSATLSAFFIIFRRS